MADTFKVVRHADRGNAQRDVFHGLTHDEAEAHVEDLQSYHRPDDRWPGRYTIEPDTV